ncbi:MAG: ribosome biogenesis GTPase Der [Verrucomicrobiales bacterium]
MTPVVAIVGRPNVGKSAVFNRLAGRRVSIVHDLPGVTRDRVAARAATVGVPVTLLDTGGIGEPVDDGFAAQVAIEADIAMEEADLILFVVDVKSGRTPVDDVVAERLRKKKAPVLLAVNKVDGPEREAAASDFARLGFNEMLTVSATTGRGFAGLREWLERRFSAVEGDEAAKTEDPLKIAIIGRPNVGKSSLVNAILNDERTIVSPIAGTTRDAVDIPFEKDGHHYLLIDTAGLRRRTKVETPIEAFSVERARDSVRRADLCALIVDAGAGATMQERKIAQFMLEEHKACLLVFNKFDLYHPGAKYKDRWEQLQEEARREFFFMPYAPLVAVSAKERQYLGKIFTHIEKIRAGAADSPRTGVLNRLIQRSIDRNPPPAIRGRRLKLLYATLARRGGDHALAAPVVVCFVNHKELLGDSYERYLEARIREEFAFYGLPLRFDVRERRREEPRGRSRGLRPASP